jgi:hypothetical protein
MTESQKSIKSIVENEAVYYTKEYYPFFKHVGLSEESMRDYIVAFFFSTLSKLMNQGNIEAHGVWDTGEWNG